MKKRFKKGDSLICLKYGRNNSDMVKGEKYTVSEVDADGMIKLKGHPDWWSTERFTHEHKKNNQKKQTF